MAGGNLFYAHKCGFTEKSMIRLLREAGLGEAMFVPPLGLLELHVIAFKAPPTAARLAQLGMNA